jgi:hypothetical protein
MLRAPERKLKFLPIVVLIDGSLTRPRKTHFHNVKIDLGKVPKAAFFRSSG